MPPSEVLKYLLDIESVISELEQIVHLHDNDYLKFQGNFMAVRAAERDLMIIGEAINKLKKLNFKGQISGARQIIGLRNLIAHSYDSIDPTIIWTILQKDLPVMKQEILAFKGK
ncbi:HepT-like ribonuclease domain-containing protein [Luteibaculum oceani]|uniref:DUF86 domain-containing protein n=1 Tax=Luteibaculum oceani TaxID=1294296 RepID=A0A5C6VIN6_9FLAO|nr:HepT-like ribonuclease domain-containing protein [Luteibaculum oceani]TXC85452.1 DUF86 domain-containing protein [Luteibaculum oceani]